MDKGWKRRKFIKASLVAPIATGSAGRLYGSPASIDPSAGAGRDTERLILPLANAGLPATELNGLSKVSALIEGVLTDSAEAGAFAASPGSYLASYGLDGSDRTLADTTISMLVALADADVQESLRVGDYERMFQYMMAAGVLERRDPSLLQARVQAAIESNVRQIKGMMGASGDVTLTGVKRSQLLSVLQEGGFVATEDDLAIAAEYLRTAGDVTIAACSAMAACVVGIALLAALYVSITIAFTVSILAAISISVSAGVVVIVSGRKSSMDPVPFNGEPVPYGVEPVPFNGQFMRLDPAAIRNIQRTFQMAAISNDQRLEMYATREIIREEATAVLWSLSNLRLIQVPAEHMPLAIEAISSYACKAAGVRYDNAY